MSTIQSTASDTVRTCDCKHCQRLTQYLIDEGIPFDRLRYEDVFTPLKHHDIRLVVQGDTFTDAYLVRSDLCFKESAEAFDWGNAIDPFDVWDMVKGDVHIMFEVRE
jgi:hypothetical protein